MSLRVKEEGIVEVTDTGGNSVTYYEGPPGVFMPPLPVPDVKEHIESMKTFVARPSDIWISACMKSGTHWIWEAVSMMLSGKTELHKETKGVGMLEFQSQDELEAIESPRVLNTHVPLELFPDDVWKKGCKILYLYRNPKDVAVSCYHHMQNDTVFGKYKGTFQEYCDAEFCTKYNFGGWYKCVLGWYNAHKENPNVLFMAYEQIHKDTLNALKKITKFLDLKCTDDYLSAVVDAVSIKNMRENKKGHHIPNDKIYRKGIVGDWKHAISVAISERFDAEFDEKMKTCDLPVYFEL